LTLVSIVAVALAVILGAEVITRLLAQDANPFAVAVASVDVVVIASTVVATLAVAASVLVDAAAPGPYPGR
jgi:hypothetical protein